jgi:hypothetical protein
MKAELSQPLMKALAVKKNAIIKEWLARTLQTYPEHTARFLLQEKDPFRNPVGHTLKQTFLALFNELLGGMNTAKITPLLEDIVRIRAVQDFTAGQAVAFIFLLKKVIGDELKGEIQRNQGVAGLATMESRIDEMALLAFDLFMKCREKIYEIRTNEAKRRMYVLERLQSMEPAAEAPDSDVPSEQRP